MTNKRGYSYAEALVYVGVKRRTFDQQWRPRLVAIPQGVSLIFDRADLDRVFDEIKREAAGEVQAANDGAAGQEQNAPRNGRPANEKGKKPWANQPKGSTAPETVHGKSTSGGEVHDFASAVSLVTRKRKAG